MGMDGCDFRVAWWTVRRCGRRWLVIRRLKDESALLVDGSFRELEEKECTYRLESSILPIHAIISASSKEHRQSGEIFCEQTV